MKVKRKKWTTFTAAAVAAVVFCLLFIPLCAVLLLGTDASEPDKEKLDIEERVHQEISLWRSSEEKVLSLDLEDYVSGVVAGEMPSDFESEALKAQAVAARTYALARVEKGNPLEHPEAPLCDTTHCQVYRSEEELKDLKGRAWIKDDWPRIKNAVNETFGQVMFYNGELVEQPLFHSSSGGKTENSEDVFVSAVPYLRSVSSDYEEDAPYQQETVTLSFSDLRAKIKKAFGDPGQISKGNVSVLALSEGGRVSKVQVGSLTLTGRQIRETLGLRSAAFSLRSEDDSITFTTKGYGHGVGMSQWGANGMAKAGYDYKQILQHYYSGVEVW